MSNVFNMVSEQTFVTQTNAIKNAIDAIGGGGGSSDVFLLQPTGTVTAANGSFSVPYVGTEPQVNTAAVLIPNTPKGISTDLISYTLQFSGGNAVFTASAADGTLSTAVDCAVQIGTGWHKVTIQNLPVNYLSSLDTSCELTFSKMGDEEYPVYVASLQDNLYPKNVTPIPASDAVGLECILKDSSDNLYLGQAMTTAGSNLVIDPSTFAQEIDMSSITEGYCWGAYAFKFEWALAVEE